MAIQNDNTLVTKGDLKDLYTNKIAPYLGANLQLKTNNSAYYSTDEKVVGVWIDGKPLYQKTLYYDTLPNQENRIDVTALNIDQIVTIYGMWHRNDVSSNWYPFSGLDLLAAGTSIGYGNRDQCIYVFKNLSYSVDKAYATIQYTKTTDTASSSLITPGCYDINFPNTWPENKEIFFGNGLYGRRFTGTISAAANTFVAAELLPAGSQAIYIVNSGGRWNYTNSGQSMTLGTTWTASGYSNGIDNMTPAGSAMNFGSISGAVRSNAPYDIWVTYTK